MKKDQVYTENEINAQVSSNQQSDEPNSAHATVIAEKYVKKRKEKAEKQSNDEYKADSIWNAIKYVIL